MKLNVYIVNKSGHDISDAERFGDIVYLSSGPHSRYATNNIYRTFKPILEVSHPDDYLLLTGLTIMNVIAASIMAMTHGKLNLLIHRPVDNTYVLRQLDMNDLLNQHLDDLAKHIQEDSQGNQYP